MDNMMSGVNTSDYASIYNQTTSNLESNLKKTLATDDEMMISCKEFEAYMLEQVYKSMEKNHAGNANTYIFFKWFLGRWN